MRMRSCGQSFVLVTVSIITFLVGTSTHAAPSPSPPVVVESTSQRHIVVLSPAPVARYDGSQPGLWAIPRIGAERLDLRSAPASAYQGYLRANQARFVQGVLEPSLGRPITVRAAFQYAINAVVLDLSTKEAEWVRRQPGVVLVEPERMLPLATDLGPTLITANDVWAGAGTVNNLETRGEGVVVGVIDSGINFRSPSFAAMEPTTGYVHTNPLGAGVVLGQCAAGGVDEGSCNDKLIGAYDFVYDFVCTPNFPATDPCRSVAEGGTFVEERSATDNDGHGSHTASTSAGNAVGARYKGSEIPISGVAPHANIIAFDACYFRVSDQAGLCPSISAVAAIEQAVALGIVDVINYSIGGGAEPWEDSVSLAFLGASEAGIVVSTSAGNEGPDAGTLGHVEPWTITSAASSHARAGLINVLHVDPLPANPVGPQNVRIDLGGAGRVPDADIAADLVLSPGYAANANVANDGCNVGIPATSPYAPAQLANRVVMIRRGGCTFSEKASNAESAGAVAVLMAQNAAGFIAPSASPGMQVAVPVYGVPQADALSIRQHVLQDPSPPSVVHIPLALTTIPTRPDVMADFSSRGPSFHDLLKPDVTAPGLSILAAYAGDSESYELLQGTSMSTPHTTGAAALLRALHPDWTPGEIKSALVMTADSAPLLDSDGISPTDPWDRGAGRLVVRDATKAGLLLDETVVDYIAANPSEGGSPSDLNLPSLAHQACIGTCIFTRQFRSVAGGNVTWAVTVEGDLAPAAQFPASFVVDNGDTYSLQLSIDAAQLPMDEYRFGVLVLTPSVPTLPVLRLPMAVRAAPVNLEVFPESIDANVAFGQSVTRAFDVRSVGNSSLVWEIVAGLHSATVFSTPPTSNGRRAQFYTSFGVGEYVADDFPAPAPLAVTHLRADGFVLPGGVNLAGGGGIARGASFFVYADAQGVPSGAPEVPGAAPPLWEFTSNFPGMGIPAPGISMTDNNIAIDLDAAGAPPLQLEGGRYWLSVVPWIDGEGDFTNAANAAWAWRLSPALEGATVVSLFPAFGDTDWQPTEAAGLAMQIDGEILCGANWIAADHNAGVLGADEHQTVTVTMDATGLEIGEHRAVLCVTSNDPAEPLRVVPVVLRVDGVQTDMTVLATAVPDTVSIGEPTQLMANLTRGTFPTSSGVEMTADLRSIGGPAEVMLFDNGADGDLVPGDDVFVAQIVVPFTAEPGLYALPLLVTDAEGRAVDATIPLEVRPAVAPTATAFAMPDVSHRGGFVRFEVAVEPGLTPPSTGLAVSADLTALGGDDMQSLVDDGTLGDAAPGDNVFTGMVQIGPDVLPGLVHVAFAISDAQFRRNSANATVLISAATDLAAEGAASPTSVARGADTLVTVEVTPGLHPESTDVRASVDISAIGGGRDVSLHDDGTFGDAVAGDGTWSRRVSVAHSTAAGEAIVFITVRDAQDRRADVSIALDIAASEAPSGVGMASPAIVAADQAVLLSVDVTPGTSPDSTNLYVTGDLSLIGGGIAESFYDDGTHGDHLAGDGRFTLLFTVGADTPTGPKTLLLSIGDAQQRSASAHIELQIVGPEIFRDGFEG